MSFPFQMALLKQFGVNNFNLPTESECIYGQVRLNFTNDLIAELACVFVDPPTRHRS